MLRVTENGNVVAEVPAKSLADESPLYYRNFTRPEYMDRLESSDLTSFPCPKDLGKTLLTLLGSSNLCSKEWIYSQFDHMVRTNTLVRPGGDAGVIGIEGTQKGIALSVDCNSRYCFLNPYEGAKAAVCEGARNITSSGGRAIAITDCLNFASPEDEGIYYQFRNSILGINEASRILGAPVISGNVSFYNQSDQGAIYPTPVMGMLGLIENVENRMDMHFKDEGDMLILVGETRAEIGGSEYLAVIHGVEEGKIPEVHVEVERITNEGVLEAIGEGLIKSAHDLSDGGLGIALAECCFKRELGASVNLKTQLREDVLLFSESHGRYILTSSSENAGRVTEIFRKLGVEARVIGEVKRGSLDISINNSHTISVTTTMLKDAWKGCLPCTMK